jgi:hypothetical protein
MIHISLQSANMVLQRNWPLTRGRYISQMHIDYMVSNYGTCSIFTHVHIIINNSSKKLWVLIFMESNKMFFAFFYGLK